MTIQAQSYGPIAGELINSGERLTVIAKFERSLYLECETGGLICLGRLVIGDGPLNILAEFNDRFSVGADIEIDLSIATPWAPTSVNLSGGRAKAALARLDAGMVVVPPRGLAVKDETPVSQRTDPAREALVDWYRSDRETLPPEVPIRALLGLGEGLTPAGDDLLVGWMLGLQTTGQKLVAERLYQRIQSLAPDLTNAISQAHLAAGARGLASAALHDLLLALSGVGGVTDALKRIDRIGHSSGWDALAGLRDVLKT
ncbi:MAG: DUF2877 domain-containing protein [Rhodospirillaceae bacterium]|jgi:hypothetical protein|nr:DUF2877 domain-containing protein [Rhodospirillaceae bacterium]